MRQLSIKCNCDVLSYDRTDVFNAAHVVNLPAPIKGNKFLGGVVNGWVLSGTTQAQSGPPLQPNTSGSLNAGWPTDMQPTDYLGTNAFANTMPELLMQQQPGAVRLYALINPTAQ